VRKEVVVHGPVSAGPIEFVEQTRNSCPIDDLLGDRPPSLGRLQNRIDVRLACDAAASERERAVSQDVIRR
jgi:hypothetical protein